MKNNTYILLFIVLISCSNKKHMNNSEYNGKINLKYNYYILANDSIIIDLSYLIPSKHMIFNKQRNQFITNLNTNINIINDNAQIFSDSWIDTIAVNYYEDTKSSNRPFNYSLKLTNTKNRLSLTVNDYSNHKYWHIDKLVIIEDYEYLSNLTLYKKNNNIFEIFENSYLEQKIDNIWMKFQLLNYNSDEKVVCELNEFANMTKTIVIDKEKISNNNIYYLPLDLSQFKNQVKISINYKSEYREIVLRLVNDDGLINYEDLFGPIEYLLAKKDYLSFIELDSLKKNDFIFDYWNKQYNPQLLQEFHNRIKYVNIHYFEGLDKGWKSDRGRIYILNGPPLSINYEFNENGEFEIWTYNSKRFIFINRYGTFECYMCN